MAISWATLGTLPDVITASKFPTPAVIVIGDVAALSDTLACLSRMARRRGLSRSKELKDK
jgi:siroheme synthase